MARCVPVCGWAISNLCRFYLADLGLWLHSIAGCRCTVVGQRLRHPRSSACTQTRAQGACTAACGCSQKQVADDARRWLCGQANAIFEADEVKTSTQVDVAFAVATPNGLITPIVKAADCKGLRDISAVTKATFFLLY